MHLSRRDYFSFVSSRAFVEVSICRLPAMQSRIQKCVFSCTHFVCTDCCGRFVGFNINSLGRRELVGGSTTFLDFDHCLFGCDESDSGRHCCKAAKSHFLWTIYRWVRNAGVVKKTAQVEKAAEARQNDQDRILQLQDEERQKETGMGLQIFELKWKHSFIAKFDFIQPSPSGHDRTCGALRQNGPWWQWCYLLAGTFWWFWQRLEIGLCNEAYGHRERWCEDNFRSAWYWRMWRGRLRGVLP